MRTCALLLPGLAMLAGCSTMGEPAGSASASSAGRTAVATLRTPTNAQVGTVRASESDGRVRVAIDARGLPQGLHGAHVHMTGRCDAPDFTTAGGHWNPTGREHGMENPAGPHAGDAPNLTIGADGSGRLAVTLPAGSTMAGLMDGDGSAFVIHATADDLRTDPSGNSGGRIACGVFQPA